MTCEQFRKFELQYRHVNRRLWRYTHPHADPLLILLGDAPNTNHVERAREEESLLRERLEEHARECILCSLRLQQAS